MFPSTCKLYCVGFHCLTTCFGLQGHLQVCRIFSYARRILLSCFFLFAAPFFFTWSHSACFSFVFCSCSVFFRYLCCFLACVFACSSDILVINGSHKCKFEIGNPLSFSCSTATSWILQTIVYMDSSVSGLSFARTYHLFAIVYHLDDYCFSGFTILGTIVCEDWSSLIHQSQTIVPKMVKPLKQ
jgi:hypothetical protein